MGNADLCGRLCGNVPTCADVKLLLPRHDHAMRRDIYGRLLLLEVLMTHGQLLKGLARVSETESSRSARYIAAQEMTRIDNTLSTPHDHPAPMGSPTHVCASSCLNTPGASLVE